MYLGNNENETRIFSTQPQKLSEPQESISHSIYSVVHLGNNADLKFLSPQIVTKFYLRPYTRIPAYPQTELLTPAWKKKKKGAVLTR